MKQQYAVVVLFALIIASSMLSLTSYRTTKQLVTADMSQALAKALEEQQSNVISADTIRVFNSHLQIEGLKGKAILAVDTKLVGGEKREKGRERCEVRPQVSAATILSLSDQRPSMILWSIALIWSLLCFYQHRHRIAMGMYGGLILHDDRFIDVKGIEVKLTPMQQQLMEMLWHAPCHRLSKTEICDALWPKKEDANDTLYTLIRRLKPIIEAHSDIKIESDRGKAYRLTIR